MAFQRSQDYERSTPHKEWTPDQCANAVFLPLIRPEWHPPGEGSRTRGRFVIASAHAIRAKENPDLGNHQEPCKQHYGRITIKHGRAVPVMCSNPAGGIQRTHFGVAVANGAKSQCQPGDFQHNGKCYAIDPKLIRPGRFGFPFAYEAPVVTEAFYHAPTIKCGGIG